MLDVLGSLACRADLSRRCFSATAEASQRRPELGLPRRSPLAKVGFWSLPLLPPQFIRPTVPRPVNIDDLAHFIRPRPSQDPSHPSQSGPSPPIRAFCTTRERDCESGVAASLPPSLKASEGILAHHPTQVSCDNFIRSEPEAGRELRPTRIPSGTIDRPPDPSKKPRKKRR